MKDANLEKHVKLGPGAIRDIEFTVQCLQMIHGAKRKSLCSHNTLETLAALKENALLNPEDADALTAAYRFLRTVENCIQIEADQQRYSIPAGETEERELARRIGYQHTAGTDALGNVSGGLSVPYRTGACDFSENHHDFN